MKLLIILLLILLNGIFSMSEIAVVSARKSRLETAAKRGNKNAKAALETANSPNRFLSTVQIGITLIGILTGIFSGEKITYDLRSVIDNIPFIKAYSQTIAVTIVVITVTFLTLVIGELVPKRVALTNPEGIAKIIARPMQVLTSITAPFVWLLTFTSDLLIKMLHIQPSEENKITEEEIKAIIQEGTEYGAVQQIEQDIMERVFSMGDRKISSLMTHRNDTVFLKTDYDSETIKRIVNNEMHSVYPVIENREDDVIGIVMLKDLFKYISYPEFKITDHIKQPQYLSENISAYETLKIFKTGKLHQAIVIDEFGQMEGLITMNDLLEALVGDVSDFHSSEFSFVQREDGSWLVDGQYPFPELLRKFDMDELITDYPFNTISGLILHELKKIPVTGDKFRWLNFEIEIVDMDRTRIDKILLTNKSESNLYISRN